MRNVQAKRFEQIVEDLVVIRDSMDALQVRLERIVGFGTLIGTLKLESTRVNDEINCYEDILSDLEQECDTAFDEAMKDIPEAFQDRVFKT